MRKLGCEPLWKTRERKKIFRMNTFQQDRGQKAAAWPPRLSPRRRWASGQWSGGAGGGVAPENERVFRRMTQKGGTGGIKRKFSLCCEIKNVLRIRGEPQTEYKNLTVQGGKK